MKQTDAKLHCADGDQNDPGSSGGELALLEKACRMSGRSLGFWTSFTDGLDEKSLALLAARAHMISPDITASCDALQRDQSEAVSLFSQVGDRDREALLVALRSLVELRKGRLN
ncbi:hypothetical protein [Leisingera sp. ANG-M1]|uniref:hypothetical protein n=1 Tax=Leisingera sp. ANG-M1 TaxID=1577895 RepID=UPI0012699BA7|nr:hypothetical protein [Leisingera sp. ANG-M1]